MRTMLWRALAAAVTVSLLCVVVPTADAAAVRVNGPDVSGHQHLSGRAISWGKVAASGNEFGFVKATEGTGYTNPYFSSDSAAMRAAGMVRGAYHFARPAAGTANALAQARHFVAVTGLLKGPGQLPAVLDLETSGGLGPTALIGWTRTYLNEIQRLTGRKPIIYTYPVFWRTAMHNTSAFTSYPLWIATYSSAPQLIGGWSHYTFWQYSSHGSVPGVSGSVDVNVFNGSPAALRALADVVLAPTAPRQLAAAADVHGGTSVALRWAVPISGSAPSGYRVSVDGHQVAAVSASVRGYTATGLSPGGHQFSVTAYNYAGTGTAATATASVIIKPATPANLTLGTAGTTVTAAWAPPSNAGELTGYHVSVDANPRVDVPAAKPTYALTNLTPGTHRITVTAYNRLGDGPAAIAAATVIVKPAAPTNLKLAVSGTTLTATWAKPAADPGQLTGYRIRVDSGTPKVVPATATTWTASNLTPGPHTLSVLAFNSVGDGASASAAATVIVAPTAPTGLRTSVMSGIATVSWAPPTAAGGELLGYQVQVDDKAPVEMSAAVTSQTVTGLAPGGHRIAVAAYNSAGASPQIATVALVVVDPGEPTAVRVTSTLSTAELTWAAPADDGGQLSGYLVWVDGGTARAVPAGATGYNATGLSVGAHTLEVAAYNVAGSSHPVLLPVTIVLPPSAPTLLRAQARSGAVALTWAAPTQSGGAPLNGYRVTVDGRPVAQVTATAYTVTGVAPGWHTLTVAGSSSVGGGDAASVRVLVLPTPGLTVAISASRVEVGARFTLSGVTGRRFAGQIVSRQVYGGGVWHTIAHATVDRSGRYAFGCHAATVGVHAYRVSLAATGSHYAALSATVRVRSLAARATRHL